MKFLRASIFFTLLLQYSKADEIQQVYKGNMVSNQLDKVLSPLLESLKNGIQIPKLSLGEEIGGFSAVDAKIDNVTKVVDGLGSMGFKLVLNISRLNLKGKYNVQNIEIPDFFPVFGKGDFKAELNNIYLKIHLSAVYMAADEKFNVKIQDFDASVKNATVNFENLMDDPFMGDFLSELLSKLIPNLIQVFAKPLVEILSPIIDFYGNGIISCIKKELISGKINECIKNFLQGNSINNELIMAAQKLRQLL